MGVVVVPSGSAPSGTALTLIRRALTKRIGRGVVYLTTDAATGRDRRRQLVIDRIGDDEIPLEGLAGLHCYVYSGAEAGHQTRIGGTGTHGPVSILEMTKRTTTVVGSGIEIELSGSLPAVSYLDWPAMNDVVNQALHLPVHVYISVTYVSRQVRYDLSGLPWRVRDTDVLDVYPPIVSGMTASQTTSVPISQGLWSVEYAGESPYLQLRTGWNDGDIFFVKLRRPAGSWINNSGWGDSSTGLTADSQEVLYDVDSVVAVAAPIACDRLESYWRDKGDDAAGDRWARKRAELVGAAVLTRFARAFRSNGRQRVGAVGRRR